MKTGSTRAMGQKRKYRALKLLLPLLAFALLLGFGPQAGVSYAQPGEDGTSAPAQTTSGPADPASPDSNGAPSSLPQENAPASGQQAPAQPSGEPAQEPQEPTGENCSLKNCLNSKKLFYGGQEVKKDDKGSYVAHPDTPYQLQLGFKEKPDSVPRAQGQIPLGKELTYDLPKGLEAVATKGVKKFSINLGAGKFVEGNEYWVKDNQIHVKLQKNEDLEGSAQMEFYVTLDVKIAKDASKIDLNDTIHMNVVISNDPDLSITKSARHDFAAGKVFYTLTVTSIDTNENVLISDQINGKESVLTLDPEPKNIKVKSNKQKNLKPKDVKIETNGFHLIIPKMTHGEQVTVEYAASVDYSKIDPEVGGSVEQTKNDAKVVSDQIPAEKETTNDLASQLKIGTITKNAGAAKETPAKSGIYEQSWTLDVNKYSKLNVAGNTVKDSIPDKYKTMMKYSGKGITIVANKGKKVKKDGQEKSIEKTYTVEWKDLATHNDHEWSYILPKDDPEKSSYEITYTTEVNVSQQIVPTAVENGASSKKEKTPEGQEEKVTVPTNGLNPPHIFNVQKKAFKADKDEVTWEVAVNVVPQGYKSLKLTDTLPAAKSGDKSFQDKFIPKDPEHPEKDITVENLLEGESWTFAKDPENPDSGFSITFYQDEAKKITGLKPNPNKGQDGKPMDRQVTVKFTTKNDEEWVKAYRAGDDSLYRHVNRVKATANGIDRTASADAAPTLENINKTFSEITYKEIGGVDYPLFHYRLRLEGLGKCKEGSPNSEDLMCKAETFKIFDQFDAEKLKLATDPKPTVSGSDKLQVTEKNGNISFIIKKTDLPDQEVHYLDYWLIPSSRANLDAINKDPKGLKVSNTATWGPVTTKAVDADYLYAPLTKQLTDKPTLSNNYVASFTVTINPGGLDIANGAPTANFKDQMTNLRLQPETLKMTPADYDYRPVYKDGVLTMQVPNEQKVVVTYKAKVIGKDLVNYGNEVEVGKERSAVNASVAVRLDAIGSAPNPAITIHKHDSRDLTTQLEGAEFELYRVKDGKAEPLMGKLTPDQAEKKPLRFTTDENGEVTIRGDEKKLGWTLLVSDEKDQYEYQLKEVKSPKGYKLLEEPLTFTIWKNPADETQQYDGAYIYVANEPEPGIDIPGKHGDVHKQLGKTGAQVSVALGAMLACLAGGYLILRRREQR